MNKVKIVRGRISHTVSQDLSEFLKALFHPNAKITIPEALENEFAEYMGSEHCVVFPYARTAIYYILKNLNLPTGSKILMPPLTIKGILDAVLDLGLVPVFCDLDPENACFALEDLKIKLDEKPKVAIVTYLFGLVPNVEAIMKLLKKNNVYVIEDFSQNLNSKFKGQKIGNFGDAGVYSASSVKTLDAYSGGFVITNNLELFKNLKIFQKNLKSPKKSSIIHKIWMDLSRNLATTGLVFGLVTINLIRTLNLLNNDKFHKFVGERSVSPISKLPDKWFENYPKQQGIFALKQISEVEEKDSRRISVHSQIETAIPLKYRLNSHTNSVPNHWQHVIYVEKVNEFRNFMLKNGIDVGTTSLVLLSQLDEYGFSTSTPNASRLHKNGVYLPNYYQLEKGQIEYLKFVLNEWFSSHP